MSKLHIATSVALTLLIGSIAHAQPSASYLYRLSDFSGPVASLWARIAVDQQAGEIYTLNRSDAIIQIFNDTAMQIFACGENLTLASAIDIAAAENGELLVLYRSPRATVRHLDYRGALLNEIKISTAGQDFNPAFLDYQDGKLYLADAEKMQVVVTALNGEVIISYNFRQQISEKIRAAMKQDDLRETQRKRLEEKLAALKGADLTGFSVDPQGNLLFTIAPLFTAFRVTAQGEMVEFGTPGGAPGKFGVIASISADRDGNIFVSDRLRCVVLMFDNQLNFLTEFGYRGEHPDNLVVPDDIAIDGQTGRIYVAQAANLGVSVFSIKHTESGLTASLN